MKKKETVFSELSSSVSQSKKPIPELKLGSQYTEYIFTKRKCTTIRKGRRKITPGPLIFSTENDSILVWVNSVRFKKFSNLNESEAIDDGYESIQELRQDLQKIYPDITDNNFVTIVKFSPSLA